MTGEENQQRKVDGINEDSRTTWQVIQMESLISLKLIQVEMK
jgi:hypothetical protein